MTGEVLLSVVVLAAAGALPTVALTGFRPVTVPLLPLTGAALAGLSATCCLVVAGDLWEWFVALSLVAAGSTVAVWILRPSSRPTAGTARGGWSWPIVLGLLLVLAAVAWSLRGLATTDIGFDARMLWLVRGAWFVRGHDVARSVLSNRVYQFAEPSFPPLVGASAGVGWIVNRVPLGSPESFRLGQIIVGVVNGCGLMALGAGVLEITGRRRGPAVASPPSPPGPPSPSAPPSPLAEPPPRAARAPAGVLAGLVVAPVLCVAVAGSAGNNLTNGYADAPWVMAAAFAVVFGLVLPVTRSNVGVAVVGIAVAGQIKLEGTVTVGVLVVLMALRCARTPGSGVAGPPGRPPGPERRDPVPGRRSVVVIAAAAVAAVAALAAWPLAAAALGAVADADTSGTRHGTLVERLHATTTSLYGHLHILPVAALVALVGAVALRGPRRRLGLGGDLGLWVVVAGNLVVVAGTYVFGATPVGLWLSVSSDRVVLFAVTMALVDLAVWALVASVALWPQATIDPTEPDHRAQGAQGAHETREDRRGRPLPSHPVPEEVEPAVGRRHPGRTTPAP